VRPGVVSLDWRIYCQLYRQLDDPVWGMFPHPPVNAIAKSLGVARATVWRRLREWEKSGFVAGSEVFPNPRLLGVGLVGYRVIIPDTEARQAFAEELEQVDGVVFGVVNVGGSADIIAVSDLPASRARREERLRRISGVKSVDRGTQVWFPPCLRKVSPEDWRFINEVRRHPTWSVKQLADALDISTKTASKRYLALRTDRALLALPVEDFAKFNGVVAGGILILAPGAEAPRVRRAVEQRMPDALIVGSWGQDPAVPSPIVAFLQLVQKASDTEAAAALAIPGVARQETFYPGTARAYRHWFDARLFETLAKHGR
jgi:DNA-binding Lrp family transcriptional regulator